MCDANWYTSLCPYQCSISHLALTSKYHREREVRAASRSAHKWLWEQYSSLLYLILWNAISQESECINLISICVQLDLTRYAIVSQKFMQLSLSSVSPRHIHIYLAMLYHRHTRYDADYIRSAPRSRKDDSNFLDTKCLFLSPYTFIVWLLSL